jgi:hypothetical protein
MPVEGVVAAKCEFDLVVKEFYALLTGLLLIKNLTKSQHGARLIDFSPNSM